MISKSKICLFSIGNAFKEAGGPKTRITSIAKAIQEQDNNNVIILGSRLHKLKKTLAAPKFKILYVETNTSYFKIVDFICLLILSLKSEKVVIYIRDVYYELFDKKKNTFKSIKNFIFHKSANLFYTLISDEMTFPTLEMGDLYFKKNKYYFKRSYFAFPPGTILPGPTNEILYIKTVKFLYLGSTRYQNSGFDTFISLAKALNHSFEFHILTPDDISKFLTSNFQEIDNKNIKVLSLSHSEVLKYIRENQITFAIHSRPRNSYDDITFPIKFMDFISCLLPVITFPHKPIVSLLGKEYPFYINELTEKSLLDCLERVKLNPSLYKKVREDFLLLRTEKLYINQIKNLTEKEYS